jgi:subtilisin family serine protease
VTAYYVSILADTEDERARATTLLREIEIHGSYIIGLTDEDGLRAVKDAGVAYSVAAAAPAPRTRPKVLSLPAAMMLGVLAPSGPSLAERLRRAGASMAPRYVIALAGPLTSMRRETLKGYEVKIEGKVEGDRFVATAPDASISIVRNLPFVQDVEEYDAYLTFGAGAAEARAGIPGLVLAQAWRAVGRLRFRTSAVAAGAANDAAVDPEKVEPERGIDVICHDPADIRTLAEVLNEDSRVTRVDELDAGLRVWVRGATDSAQFALDLAHLPTVSLVDPYVAPEVSLDHCAAVLWGQAGTPAPAPLYPWRGKGQRIGVADSGLDASHPDFSGRVTVVPLVAGAAGDPLGHGTHVASIIAGDGGKSGGVLRGIAPEAEIYFQTIGDGTLALPGLAGGVTPILSAAYAAGCRVHNNSWGANKAGRYTKTSSDMDAFAFANQDFVIVVAAGNVGQQDVDSNDGLFRQKLGSLAAPASAKNVIAVGACCTSRSDGPYAGRVWRDYDGQLPPPEKPDMATLPITGDRNVIAALSSRGPADDANRIKPDLLAPGVSIAAARSAGETDPRHPYGPAPDYYCFKTGTSMAAPVVSAAAAIVRQYYIEVEHHEPSAALVRATLINGAQWIAGALWETESGTRPNAHQGFGRLDLSQALPVPGSTFLLKFRDFRTGGQGAISDSGAAPSGAEWRSQFRVRGGRQLSITMTWTDPPGRGAQNNLDLKVRSPSRVNHVANARWLAAQDGMQLDHANTVQQVRIEDPEPGDWLLIVSAWNTMEEKRGFAVVISGASDELQGRTL